MVNNRPRVPAYTRQQLEGFLRDGYSVIIAGEHIDKIEDLPSAADLAGADPLSLQSAADDIVARMHRDMMEYNRIQERMEAASTAKTAFPEGGYKAARPHSAGPIPAEGPIQPAPIDPERRGYYGDGHDPEARPEPSVPFTIPSAPPRGVNRVPIGGAVQAGGVAPPDPRLNRPGAHRFARPRREAQADPDGQKYNPGADLHDTEEDGEVGNADLPRSVQEMIAGMTEEEKVQAQADAAARIGQSPPNPPAKNAEVKAETNPDAAKPEATKPETAKPEVAKPAPAPAKPQDAKAPGK